jgi:hypothetical protein
MATAMKNKVFVVGVGMTKFEKPGRREGWDYPQMAKESGTKALADAGIEYGAVQQGSPSAPTTARARWATTSRRWPRSTSSRFRWRRGCSGPRAAST